MVLKVQKVELVLLDQEVEVEVKVQQDPQDQLVLLVLLVRLVLLEVLELKELKVP